MKHTGIISILYAAFAACSLLMCGCSSSVEDDPAQDTDICQVAFRLGGAAGSSSSSRAEAETTDGKELQTNLEKRVNTLLAFIFKDEDPGGDTEDNDNDKFFRMVEIDLGGKTDPVIDDLTFSVGDEGDYLVTFVANIDKEQDPDLAEAIAGLQKGVTTIGQFKNLEVLQSPDTKPGMLMTSGFIRFHSSLIDPVNLGTVYLRRIMSRIDIINMAPGVTVTRAVLHNRTIKSLLYNDATLQVKADYIEDPNTKEYTIDPVLAGNMDTPAKYEAKIYSYEQLADHTQGIYQPSVDIYYKKDGSGEQEFKHTVELKVPESEADDAPMVPIGLKRNNAYLIYLRVDAGDIRFRIKVEDWVEGEAFTVTDQDLTEGALGIPTAPGTVTGGTWGSEEAETVTAE